MTDTVFTEEKGDNPKASKDSNVFSETSEPQITDAASQLVGEGKRYRDVEALAKGRVAADEHIKKLETENEQLRKDAASAVAREDILNELKTLTSNQSTQTTSPETDTVPPLPETDTVGSEDVVAQLVRQQLNAISADEQAARNEMDCSNALKAKYGDTVHKVLADKAAELGVSESELARDAQVAPAKLLALFGISSKTEDSQVTAVAPVSTTNTSTERFETSGSVKKGSKEYFENMRKTDPALYRKPSTQRAILKAHEDGLYGL